jgi:hypothetical protein
MNGGIVCTADVHTSLPMKRELSLMVIHSKHLSSWGLGLLLNSQLPTLVKPEEIKPPM